MIPLKLSFSFYFGVMSTTPNSFFKKWSSIFGIFGIWHDCKTYHFFLFILEPKLICIIWQRKFCNTMCCRNHKIWRNNWSREEILKWLCFSLIDESWFGIIEVKWYHKSPIFNCRRNSVIMYFSKDMFQKNLSKFVTCLPFRILLSIAIIEWRPKQNRKIVWNCIFSLSNPKL